MSNGFIRCYMKPRTKLQLEVYQLMNDVLGLSSDHKRFAEKQVVSHLGYRKKKGVTCMDCGQFFEDDSDQKQMVCPHCEESLRVVETKKRTYNEQGFFSIATTHFGFQIIKFIHFLKECKAGQKSRVTCYEVSQSWIRDNVVTVIARPMLQNHGWVTNPFSHGDMALRTYRHDIHDVYSIKMYFESSLPEYAKLGFTHAVDDIYPLSLLRQLKEVSQIETLLKAKQYSLLSLDICNYSSRINRFWSSIKICIRNGYYVSDASIWCDYLELLVRYKKDLRNAFYVCPEDLNKAHDLYMKRKKRDDEIERKRRDAEHLLRQIEKEKEFIKQKSKFFDLTISNGEIVIIPLKTLEDFRNEGDALHHCVFSNRYFEKENSLILSARKDEQIVETIEIDLKRFDVVQSRAVNNGNSEYHDTILNLVKKNMNLIRKKVTA